MYPCSTTATPTAEHCRIGKIVSNVQKFKDILYTSQQLEWDCHDKCFSRGLRGNRMACEINSMANKIYEDNISSTT